MYIIIKDFGFEELAKSREPEDKMVRRLRLKRKEKAENTQYHSHLTSPPEPPYWAKN
ncbi:MAG: hypothetical protein ABJB76_08985 [Candidatus Nitrosocosmicus sp.]